ncbi:MAG: GTPase Era [Candidatus Paceibacteria bacterium]
MKSGLVSIIGRTNAGKSTLMNALVGRKIAATSNTPQLTRHHLHGVMNTEEGQAVFIDTPGIFKGAKTQLNSKLVEKAEEATEGVDVILYVVDPTRKIGDEERTVYGMIRHLDQPKIMAINKMDMDQQKAKYKQDYKIWEPNFDATFEISAKQDKGLEPLKDKIMELLPEGEKLYPEDQLTNITKEFWVEEILREKIYDAMRQEIPYSTTAEVEKIESTKDEDGEDMFVIEAKIVTNTENHKSMLIGKNGQKIKQIGRMARKELEYALNKKVYLDLEVEYDRHWVERMK